MALGRLQGQPGSGDIIGGVWSRGLAARHVRAAGARLLAPSPPVQKRDAGRAFSDARRGGVLQVGRHQLLQLPPLVHARRAAGAALAQDAPAAQAAAGARGAVARAAPAAAGSLAGQEAAAGVQQVC